MNWGFTFYELRQFIVIIWAISIVKPTRCISVSNLFYWSNILHVLDRPKHVECYAKKNKFETLMHLVGFTTEIRGLFQNQLPIGW